jgi:NADPH:quinone reductase-like Zn-dependent oxidoreductase
MRAFVLTGFDGPSATALTEVADPVPGDDSVLVAVQAAGVGAWDAQTSRGAFAGAGGLTTFPQVLGWDFAGTVTRVGTGVTDWQPGDAVLGFSPQPWAGAGAFAEAIAVPASALARRPDGLAVEAAAALPVSILTADLAVRAAVPDAVLAAGAGPPAAAAPSVLILGAVGGVGRLATQLAVAAGAVVIASVAADQAAMATALGATLVVDRSESVADQVLSRHGQVDAVIDLVGPAARAGIGAAIKDGGRFVSTVPYGDTPDERAIDSTSIQVLPNGARLAELAALAADGELRIAVGQLIPFAEAARALADVEAGAGPGKVVLDLG